MLAGSNLLKSITSFTIFKNNAIELRLVSPNLLKQLKKITQRLNIESLNSHSFITAFENIHDRGVCQTSMTELLTIFTKSSKLVV